MRGSGVIEGFESLGERPWEDPELVALHRLPMHSTGIGDEATRPTISLDGAWRFLLVDTPDGAPAGFSRPGFDDGGWSKVTVPSLFTMGDDPRAQPIYTNVQMPFRARPPFTPDENPAGVYRRTVTVPRQWRGRRVVLHVGGAESMLFVWVNGHAVGVSTDSRLAAEFDITAHVVAGRRNEIVVLVPRWSASTYVEDQDQWWHAGLHRSIRLEATAPTYLANVKTTAGLRADDHTVGTLSCDVEIGFVEPLRRERDWSVRARVETLAGRTLRAVPALGGAELGGPVPVKAEPYLFDGHVVHVRATVPAIRPWNHEDPQRYRLVVELVDPLGAVQDRAEQLVGFRRVEIVGNEFLINGEPVLLYGINRHDFDPDTGRVVSAASIRADLVLMKQFGFNAVRTSHSPNDPVLLDLCDELGLYVCDEANIESHAYNFSLCHEGTYLTHWVERGRRMVQRDCHHPSIVMWSLGNESGYGANHDALAGWIRGYDDTRPLHYEGAIMWQWESGYRVTDVLCPMYPEIADIVAGVATADRPIIMCEYSHAMGNSNGSLADYWDAIEATPGLQGGFIWEWWDHGLRQRLPDGTTRYAYGGDFGEERHDANFCCDGIVWPDRRPKPALFEHKWLARPVRITAVDAARGRFRVENRQWFSDLSGIRARYEVAIDGVVRAKGTLPLPACAPQASVPVRLPVALPRREPGEECTITFRYATARATGWAPRGHELGHDQVLLAAAAPPALAAPLVFGRAVEVGADGTIHVSALVEAPRLAIWRAAIDNDGLKLADVPLSLLGRWESAGIPALVPTVTASRVRRTDGAVVVDTTTEWHGTPSDPIVHRSRATVRGATIEFAEDVRVPDAFPDLPCLGVRFALVPGHETLEWYGRGPLECYPDRQSSSALGRYRSTVTDQYVPYVMPQEHGLHTDTRWARIGNIRIDATEPFLFSALHHTPEDLYAARHDVELVARPETIVHVDHVHRGLGTASCGPDTLPRYRVGPGRYRWTWRLSLT